MERTPPNMVSTTILCLLAIANFDHLTRPGVAAAAKPKSLCPAEFKHHCTCGSAWYNERPDVYITNCSNSNLASVQVLEELPPDTEILVLTGNDFAHLPKNVFGQVTDYEKLHEIDLSRNKIRTIDRGSFSRNERRIQKLTLNGNQWTPIDGVDIFSNFDNLRELHLSDAFSGHNRLDLITTMISASEQSLISIQVLDLSDNSIVDFDNDDFLCYLQSLRILNLSKNKLTRVSLSSRCIPNVVSLDLSRNQIVTLDQKSMSLIDTLIDTRFDLADNPFRCDCEAIGMITWWQNSTAELLAPVKCSGPKPWTERYIDTIDAAQIECEGTGPSVGTVVLIVVLLVLLALIIGLAIVNRTTVRKYFVTTTKPIRGKFEYSAISGRQENPEVDV